MALPTTPARYANQNPVERSIDNYATLDKPTQGDLNGIKAVAQVERGLDIYRAAAKNMSIDALEDERHQSSLLSSHMSAEGDPRPHNLCHAHAVISGAHQYAAELRAVAAWLKLRIDDPDNGCWLPENTAAKAQMPERLRNAIPHSRIHRYNYYFWLNREINPQMTGTQDKLRQRLNMVSLRLQAGSQPSYVMNKKGVGLPA